MSVPLRWTPGYRIIRTIYPPVDLFEDIADPVDWEALVSAEAKLNPRIRDEVGNLALVPLGRRVNGPTASIAMGAFTHVSNDRPSRFSNGGYGVWYCGDRVEVALAETAYHFQRFMRATAEPPADADFRLLTCTVSGNVEAAKDDCLNASDWIPGQALGSRLRKEGLDGIQYQSVRYPPGQAAAIFWPNCLTLPINQNEQFRYRWDGSRMTHYLARRDSMDALADCGRCLRTLPSLWTLPLLTSCQSAPNSFPRSASKRDPFRVVQVANRRAPRVTRSALTSDEAARVGGRLFAHLCNPRGGVRGGDFGQTRFLNRQLSLPVSTISQ